MKKDQILFESGKFFVGVNYWASHAGMFMWRNWDEAIVDNDLKKLSEAGKRSFLVVVSEGVKTPDGVKYGEVLTEKIEQVTGVETRFARLAHIVRGGAPTLRDRFTASRMGVRAVEMLLEGKSNIVICEIDGEIVDLETVLMEEYWDMDEVRFTIKVSEL